MATEETLRRRASRLRSTLQAVDDPIIRQVLRVVIDALEEAADEVALYSVPPAALN